MVQIFEECQSQLWVSAIWEGTWCLMGCLNWHSWVLGHGQNKTRYLVDSVIVTWPIRHGNVLFVNRKINSAGLLSSEVDLGLMCSKRSVWEVEIVGMRTICSEVASQICSIASLYWCKSVRIWMCLVLAISECRWLRPLCFCFRDVSHSFAETCYHSKEGIHSCCGWSESWYTVEGWAYSSSGSESILDG